SSAPCSRTACARCSRRRHPRTRCMARKTLLAAALCAAMVSAPQIAAQSAAPAVAPANVLDGFLAEVRTLRADFVQTVTDPDGYELQRVTGTLAVKRPNR